MGANTCLDRWEMINERGESVLGHIALFIYFYVWWDNCETLFKTNCAAARVATRSSDSYKRQVTRPIRFDPARGPPPSMRFRSPPRSRNGSGRALSLSGHLHGLERAESDDQIKIPTATRIPKLKARLDLSHKVKLFSQTLFVPFTEMRIKSNFARFSAENECGQTLFTFTDASIVLSAQCVAETLSFPFDHGATELECCCCRHTKEPIHVLRRSSLKALRNLLHIQFKGRTEVNS